MMLPIALPNVLAITLFLVRKRCPLVLEPAIERDRSSVVMLTACIAVVNGVAYRVVNRVLMPLALLIYGLIMN